MQPLKSGEESNKTELKVIMPFGLMGATLKFAYRIWQMCRRAIRGGCRAETPSIRYETHRDVKVNCIFHFSHIQQVASRLTIPIAVRTCKFAGRKLTPHSSSRSGSPRTTFWQLFVPSKTVGPGITATMPNARRVYCKLP